MVTVGEKSDTLANFIDEFYNTAIGLADWSDGDPNIVNDGSTTDWWNNARVIQNAVTGEYILIYPSHVVNNSPDWESGYGNDNTNVQGVRFIRSTGWETDGANISSSAPGIPSGDTGVVGGQDAMNTAVQNATGANTHENSFSTIVQPRDGRVNMNGLATSASNRSDTVHYAFAIGSTWYTAYMTGDESYNGYPAWTYYEQLQNDFFAHGITPSVSCGSLTKSGGTNNDADLGVYPHFELGYSHFFNEKNGGNWNMVGRIGTETRSRSSAATVGEGFWGYINPSPDDDTFFFRKVPVYLSGDQSVPISNLDSMLPGEKRYALPHGTTVTADGITYRMIRQPSYQRDQRDEWLTGAIRWE